MDLRIPPLRSEIMLESNPLKCRILVRRLAVEQKCARTFCTPSAYCSPEARSWEDPHENWVTRKQPILGRGQVSIFVNGLLSIVTCRHLPFVSNRRVENSLDHDLDIETLELIPLDLSSGVSPSLPAIPAHPPHTCKDSIRATNKTNNNKHMITIKHINTLIHNYCMCIYIYKQIYAYNYISLSLSISLSLYVYIYIYIYTYTHVCMYIYIHVYIYQYIYIYIYVCLSLSIYIYIYTYREITCGSRTAPAASGSGLFGSCRWANPPRA